MHRSPLSLLSTSTHPEGIPADLESLRDVAQAWGKRQTCTIESYSGTARMIDGCLASSRDRTVLVRALYVGGIEVDHTPTHGHGVIDPARDLWRAACSCARPERVLDALDAVPVGRPLLRRLGDLPVGRETRTLLTTRLRGRSLGDLCRHHGVAPLTVAEEISALIALGALRLKRAAPPPLRAVPDLDILTRKVELRLEREWEIVRTADAFTVLGISPSMDGATRARAIERMRARYAVVAREAPSRRAREMALRIHTRVEEAANEVLSGRARTAADQAVVDDPVGQGRALMEQGDPAAALRCFAYARKQAEDAQNVAWMGWALYNDRTRPRGRRTERGLELLALAESMGGYASEVQRLRARAEVAEGDLVRAWNRLDRLLDLNPADREARELLDQVRGELNRRGADR